MPDSTWSLGRVPFGERTVLLALVAGFGLVMMLLGAAGLVSVREGHAIRVSAEELVREEILITRLLHEAQVEEDALALALHRLARAVAIEERHEPLQELDKANRAIAKLAGEAAAAPQAEQWRRLAETAREFTAHVRTSLSDEGSEGPLPRDELEGLFSRHDVVVRLIHDLILQSTDQLAVVDQKIGRQLDDLARESATLLGACFVLALACSAGTIAYVRHSLRRIEFQADQLNQVSWHMLQSQEQTARRFSHELHDELGQSLAAVRANLTRQPVDDPEALRADSLHLVDEAIANVRELSQLLRPVILDDFGLDAGLRWLTEKFAQRTRIDVSYDSTLTCRLHNDLETHLFRIAQEALTNIARHSDARRVRMSLDESAGRVILRIEDNGRGLPALSTPGRRGLGLVGMRARARVCGGGLELEKSAEGGLAVFVSVPLRLAETEVESPGDG